MDQEKIEIGKSYLCEAVGLKGSVTGDVISKFERSSIIYVRHHAQCDKIAVVEKASKVVVRYCDFISEYE